MRTLILGIGDGAIHALGYIHDENLPGVETVAINTSNQSLLHARADRHMLIGNNALGAGGNPAFGSEAVQHSANDLYQLLNAVNRLFVISGFGGGTGTGATPALVRLARSLEVPATAVISLPFSFEGGQRNLIAQDGLKKLRQLTDEIIVVDSNTLLPQMEQQQTYSLQNAFALLDKVLVWKALANLW